MILNPLSGLFPTAQAGSLNKPGQGAAMILETAQRKVGEFKTGTPASINIRATLDQAGAEAGRQVIIRSVVNRLEGIRQGLITPDSEWETTAGYLMLTGSPFKVDVTTSGEITIDAQVESELSEYAQTQQGWIRNAIDQLAPFYEKVDLSAKKTEFRTELSFATFQTVQLDSHYPAKEKWEKDYNYYKSVGVPQKLHLDADGQLTMVNQFETDFSDIADPDDRVKLQLAINKLKLINDGEVSATELWEYQALGYKTDHDDYFLYLDDDKEIAVARNKNVDLLIPDFLLASEDDEPNPTTQWQADAIEFYKLQKPFHFDFGYDGQIKVIENNFLTMSGILNPSDKSDEILQARLNLFA